MTGAERGDEDGVLRPRQQEARGASNQPGRSALRGPQPVAEQRPGRSQIKELEAEVERLMLDGDRFVARRVPGSFLEFISRAPLADGSLDLAFDAQNAQAIFKMTDGAAA